MKKLESFHRWWHHTVNTLATPLTGKPDDATIWRVFFFARQWPIFTRLRYKKPPLTHQEQLDLLISRGLVVPDQAIAIQWLGRVNYYRLSAYLYTYRVPNSEHFKPSTSFAEITTIYDFDRQLRLLLMDGIERIEVWLRTALTYELAHRCGAFGYLKPSSFKRGFDHKTFRKTLWREQQKSKESFVQHYRRKYKGENHLPIWMATELLTLGSLSMLFSVLPLESKKSIADELRLPDAMLSGWLQSVAYMRNLCAHHARVWNRHLATSPRLFKSPEWRGVEPNKIYAGMLTLDHILSRIEPGNGWSARVGTFIGGYPTIDTRQMGFPQDWKAKRPFGLESQRDAT